MIFRLTSRTAAAPDLTVTQCRPGLGRYVVGLWLALLLGGNAAASDATVTLPGTRAFALSSQATGHDYRIEVAVPDAPPPDEGYPVLYVLDGNARLPLMVAARDVLMRRAETPWLMVGIGYADTQRLARDERTLDYTPPVLDARYAGQQNPRPAGGADAFLGFIEDELKPAIGERFALNTSREALMGHSFGGLFTLYALHQRPASFSDYIAVSPSLWWNFGDLFSDYCHTANQGERAPRGMILRGSEEGTRVPDGTPRGIAADVHERESQRADKADRLAQRLNTCRPEWDVSFTLLDGENHGSVLWPAARATLEFLRAAD